MAKARRFARLTDSLSEGWILVPELERALLSQKVWPDEYVIRVRNKESIDDGYFHPSQHALAPELQLFYEFHPNIKLPQQPPRVEQIMTFQVGSAFHALVQSMLIHLGMLDPSEVECSFVNERRHCSGTLDIRAMTMPDGRRMPVEIKSVGYVNNVSPRLMDKYIAQLNVYMDLGCEEPQEEGLLLLLEKRYPHRFKEVLVRRDEMLLKSIYRRWDRVREALEFDDPSMLDFPCHEPDSVSHRECPARFVCPLGMPTGERQPGSVV